MGYALETVSTGPQYQPLALRWDGARWSPASLPTFTGDTLLTGVVAPAKETAWAVGFRTMAGGARRTLIEHASGGTWTQVASPNNGSSATDNALMAVGGTAATGLWAVGYWLSPTGLEPLVLRYDTTVPSPSWALVSGVPSPGTVDTVLTGVAVRTASDVWAVGYYDNGSGTRPLALHWNGSASAMGSTPTTYGAGLAIQASPVRG